MGLTMNELTLRRSTKAYFVYYIASQAVFDRGIFILFLLAQGFSEAQTGLLQSILFFSAFLFEIPTGLLGDKYGRKKSVVIGLILFIAYCIGVISISGLIAFIGFYGLYGLAMSLVSGSDRALIYDHYKECGKETSFMKLESTTRSIGAVVLAVAIILGGVMQSVSWDMVYLGYAAAMSISLLAILFIPENSHIKRGHSKESPIFNKAVNYFLKGKGRRQLPMIIFMSLFSFITYPYIIFSQSAFLNQGYSVQAVAWLFAFSQLASAAGYFMSNHIGKRHQLLVLFIICPLLVSLLLLVSPQVSLMLIAFFAISFLMSLMEPIYINHINKTFESGIRAFSNSFDNFVQTIFIGFSFYCYGVLIHLFGFSLVMQISCVIPITASCIGWYYLKHNGLIS